MPKIVEGHFITEAARTRFRVWLVKQNLSLRAFAKNCGCSHQYLVQILNGKKKITPKVREHFKNGGYEIL